MARKTKKAAKKIHLRFSIDCNTPMEDGIFDIESFEKFLHERIKINGKTGVLGDTVSIRTAASKVVIDSKTHFSKRYFKYLTKKFLKKQQLRDYVRVVASSKDKAQYDLRYFQIDNDEEEE